MSDQGGGVYPPTAPAPVDYPLSSFEMAPRPTYGYLPTSPAVLKPGVIPLRPLTLGDIFNGAVNYIRTNPKTTLGITTVVVIIAQLITLAANVVPVLTFAGVEMNDDQASATALLGASAANLVAGLATVFTSVLLSGMLTMIIGRAVFGSTIAIGEVWRQLRGRVLALIGLAFLELLTAVLVIALPVVIVVAAAAAGGAVAATLAAIPLALLVVIVLVYLYTMVSFAGPLVVLERLGVFRAISRSFTLVRNGFWRTLAIRLLAQLVAFAVTISVGIPFMIAGEIMSINGGSLTITLIGFALLSIGNAIGQIIVAPFLAGVVVLLYTDRRIRWEAFDLVLQGGAASARPGGDPRSTDHLWMVRQP